MSEQVHDITSLPKTSALRKILKRTSVVALAGTAVAAVVYLKTRSSSENENVETPEA